MSTQLPKTRKRRREEQRGNYLTGKASKPYVHTPTLKMAFSDCKAGPSDTPSTEASTEKVCTRCSPVLSRYKVTFEGLVHQGCTLKRRKSSNPHPKRPNTQPYRDLNAQNAWLRSNIFDPMGNYLFCARCVSQSFHISPQWLARQRALKRAQFQSPTTEMVKSEVEKEKLGDYVVMSLGCDINFAEWWRSLDSSATVIVRYPHERHGGSGKV